MFHFTDIRYRIENARDMGHVAEIADEAFGPGRFVRAAERVREMAPADPDLSFVALHGDEVIGAVRVTPVSIGGQPSLMLGPLAVRPIYKGRGVGKALMRLTADAAKAKGEGSILLVGDLAYYRTLGYAPLAPGAVLMPGPVDRSRILGLALRDGALEKLAGPVRRRRPA